MRPGAYASRSALREIARRAQFAEPPHRVGPCRVRALATQPSAEGVDRATDGMIPAQALDVARDVARPSEDVERGEILERDVQTRRIASRPSRRPRGAAEER